MAINLAYHENSILLTNCKGTLQSLTHAHDYRRVHRRAQKHLWPNLAALEALNAGNLTKAQKDSTFWGALGFSDVAALAG